jgi:molybdenum cofactor cytidylyltransferase
VSLWGVVLAAGTSTRFGENKLLHPLSDGSPMGVAAARAMARAVPHVVAVVRESSGPLTGAFVAGGIYVVPCANADRGMGASLACGIAATPPDCQGYLVMLGDLPYLQPNTCAAVAAALSQGASLVVPVYRGQRGHPVGFSAAFRQRLLALNADVGGRDILRDFASDVRELPVDDPGIVRDVDTPTDIAAISPRS